MKTKTATTSEILQQRLFGADEGRVALDVETTGLDWVHGDRVFGAAFAWMEGGQPQTAYIDIREGQNLRFLRDTVPELASVVNHNIKFDAHMLREIGAPLGFGNYDCTMIREALLEENKYDYSLNSLAVKYLKRMKADIWEELAAIFGGKADKETQILNLHKAPTAVVAKYAERDALDALEIWHHQQALMINDELLEVHAVEKELLSVVTDMERGGVRVDLDAAEHAVKQMTIEIDRAQRELDRLCGFPVNANSSPQAKKIMGVHWDADEKFWKTKDGIILEPTESGTSGSLSTPKLYQSSLPEAQHLVTIRGFLKARDVFLKKYILEMSHKEYIHANFNQTRTEDGAGVYTGRFSITEPALQQVHKRNKKMALIVRGCFIPDAGCDWHCYDWSQVDFRAFAHYLNDPRINERYRADPRTDFHRTVSELTGLPRDRDEKTGGANAKQINLGQVFGMGAGKLAKECSLPYTVDERGFLHAGPEAEAMFAKYHENIPGVDRLRKDVSAVARNRGFIRTPLRRRIRFPGGKDAYKAAGLLYQGTAADMLKVKMVELHRYQRSLTPGSMRFALVVHDESDVMIPPGNDQIVKDVHEILQAFGPGDRIPLRIPITADHGVGSNWWEASK
jgi:DNA polymerase I-like protein with 3'-5' exonuclease and polymerase domains